MRGIFLETRMEKIDKKKLTGIDKKILSQVEYFNDNGFPCELSRVEGKASFLKKITSRIPFFSGYNLWEYRENECSNIEWVYFRRPVYLSNPFIKNLKQFKKDNPNAKVIMEIPTYPYDEELKRMGVLKGYPYLLKDRYNRLRLKGTVDRVTAISNEKEIFNIKTIKILNGIDCSKVKVKSYKDSKDEVINLGAVAIFQKSHAFERVILGLEKYYFEGNCRKVLLHMVGDSPLLAYYKRIVTERNLDEFVKFYGMQMGDDLDKIYDQVDIGIAALGMHRVNAVLGSCLKSREYLAKGLPIITSMEIDVLEGKDFKYVERFSNDDSIIDINQVVKFHDKVYCQGETYREVVENIRVFAEENCGVGNMVNPVIEYLNTKEV